MDILLNIDSRNKTAQVKALPCGLNKPDCVVCVKAETLQDALALIPDAEKAAADAIAAWTPAAV